MMAQKNFLVIGHRAHTVADWKLDDICGGAGRLDVLVRSVTAALWKSHGIRHDTDVWLSLRGKPSATPFAKPTFTTSKSIFFPLSAIILR